MTQDPDPHRHRYMYIKWKISFGSIMKCFFKGEFNIPIILINIFKDKAVGWHSARCMYNSPAFFISNILIFSVVAAAGRGYTAAHHGPAVPLSLLHGSPAQHDPHQGPAGRIRIRAAPLPPLRQVRHWDASLLRIRSASRVAEHGSSPTFGDSIHFGGSGYCYKSKQFQQQQKFKILLF